MFDYETKVDNVSVLAASSFNNIALELENSVLKSGITLDTLGSPTSAEMLAQSITRAAQGGQSYQDSGSANSYVLTAVGTYKQPTAYTDGMVVLFQAGNNNTGASTVNIASIGVADLKDSNNVALTSGVIVSGSYYFAQYDLANTEFKLITFGGSSLQHIGDGQTWQDVSGSRSVGVTYTNTTGRSIQVNVRTNGDSTIRYLVVNGINIAGDNADIVGATLSAIIPNGNTYSISGGSVSDWVELR